MSFLESLKEFFRFEPWVKTQQTIQVGNTVNGDMAAADLNITQVKTRNGVSTQIKNGHVVINGAVKSVRVNGEKLL